MSIIEDNNKKCSYIGCNKKIKLTDFTCKCKQYFCKNHIFSKNHDCEYDYKNNKNKEIEIKKLICKSNKLEKI